MLLRFLMLHKVGYNYGKKSAIFFRNIIKNNSFTLLKSQLFLYNIYLVTIIIIALFFQILSPSTYDARHMIAEHAFQTFKFFEFHALIYEM